MFNKIILLGNITRDVEVKMSSSGTHISTLNIAVNNLFNKEEVLFINVMYFGKTAELAANLEKGQKILVEGRLTEDKWEDQEGNKRSKMKVIGNSLVMIK